MTDQIRKKPRFSRSHQERPKPDQGPKIGIFWMIGKSLRCETEPLDRCLGFEGMIESFKEHSETWESLRKITPRFRGASYDENPRGRVVFRENDGVFTCYADRCLLRIRSFRKRLIAAMRLTGRRVEFVPDPHYRCRRCNPDYVSDVARDDEIADLGRLLGAGSEDS